MRTRRVQRSARVVKRQTPFLGVCGVSKKMRKGNEWKGRKDPACLESVVCRVSHGISRTAVTLKTLGNSATSTNAPLYFCVLYGTAAELGSIVFLILAVPLRFTGEGKRVSGTSDGRNHRDTQRTEVRASITELLLTLA